MPRGKLGKFKLGLLFSPEDIKAAVAIGENVDRIEAEVVKPALQRINQTTEQANDSRYLAYLLLHALMTLGVILPKGGKSN